MTSDFAFPVKFESFHPVRYNYMWKTIKMDDEIPNFDFGLDLDMLEPEPKKIKTEEPRFASLSDKQLDDLIEGAQSKSTKYATKFAVSVFKGIYYGNHL